MFSTLQRIAKSVVIYSLLNSSKMLKSLLQLSIVLAPVLVLAQRVNYPPAPSSVYAPYQQNAESQLKSILWSDDVSTAANWNFTNSSLPSNDWTIETDSTIVSTSGLIQTTSSSNGFLLFRTDTTQGAISESFAEYSGPTIDLTGNPNVRIQFEQQYISDSDQQTIFSTAFTSSNSPPIPMVIGTVQPQNEL